MKKITIIIYAILCALLAFLSSCTEKESQVEVSSVSLNTVTIEMVEGETFNLVATVLPKDAEYDGITWASSNASVASVNSGAVTALKEGTATITASVGGKSSTCSVKVSSKVIPVTSVTLDKTSLSMQVGETETLTATLNPADATDKNVTWSSSDVSVATVADGKIIAKKSGTATITAKSGNCTAECVVSVSVNTESVTLDKTTLSLAVGESAQLIATVSPADATDKNVTWTSSDESVAKVSNGTVTALKAGSATITAKCGDKTAECVVTVTIPVASISLDKSTLSLAVGESAQLIATVSPADATDKNVVWSSSDESVAKIDNGTVTAMATGSAIITAKIASFSSSCQVSVVHPDNVIYYTSYSMDVITPNNESVFGANIVSNEYNNGIGRIIFDGPVTSVGKTAFMDCTNITSMKLPDTVTRIGVGAFKGCLKLESINTPGGLSSIDSEAFSNCQKLSFFSLPEGISKIEDKTFYWCYSLVIDRIPSSVTTIGTSAFVLDKALDKLVLPYGVISIGSEAFFGSGIKELELPNSLTLILRDAFGSIKVEKLTIPGSLESFGHIVSSPILSEITVEEGVKAINREAFDGNKSLKKVILPSSIKQLYANIFKDCISLSDLYIKASIPPETYSGYIEYPWYRTDSIFGDDIDFNIWVPRNSVDAYINDPYWNRYKDHIKGYDF